MKKIIWSIPVCGLTTMILLAASGYASAGWADKLNKMTEKINQKNQQMQQQQQAGSAQTAEDPDRPLNLDQSGGSCEGRRSATCMDYMESVDKCMAPLRGYRMKLLADRIEMKLKTEDLTDEQRKNLKEDLVGIREAEKNKSDDPTIAGEAKSQRYLSDISEEDQVCVNADYGAFHKKIYNKCMGADHMGTGKRTEMMEGQETMTCDEAIAQYRAQNPRRRSSASSNKDCLKEMTGLRYAIMAQMMEKKMQKLKLSDKERSEWQADIAAVRKAAQEGGTTMPQANDPLNPMRPMLRISTPEEQTELTTEFSKQSQDKIANCSQGSASAGSSRRRNRQ